MDDRLTMLLGTILPGIFDLAEQLIGGKNGSTKFSIATRIAKAAALAAADAGAISSGEAHDDLKIATATQSKFNEVRGKIVPGPSRPHGPALPGPAEEKDSSKQPEIQAIYDKHNLPPMTTPPPGVEEYRGRLFIPPSPSAPLNEQIPMSSPERSFIPPDPLMKSAPVSVDELSLTGKPVLAVLSHIPTENENVAKERTEDVSNKNKGWEMAGGQSTEEVAKKELGPPTFNYRNVIPQK